ncbi:tyrosine-type recombinase/integrase [Kribbella sp. NPDC051137]|uniref:tyrosine-type recombinase/integrase n=1 Tax=Kribbella sp. NPDC051137 TaxID=3155045 RepID=UPI00343E30E1
MSAARGHLQLVAVAASSAGAQLLEEWADWYRAGGAADKTITTRVVNVELLAAHAGAGPAAVSSRQIVAWLADCRKPWTRSTYYTSASMWFAWLVDQGYRDDNPMDKVRRPKAPRSVPRPVSSRALADALEVAGYRARAYIELGRCAGLRVHEIAKVDGEHFADGWLYVHGKGDREAWLPVHPALEQLRRGYPSSGLWFPGSDDGHVSAQTVGKVIKRTFAKAGHPGVTAHQLRHWYGTWLLRTTKDVRVVQELMRHANLASTQIYTEVSSDAKVSAVRGLELRGQQW